jgi:DNA repair exonuclease SbcCD ATPase subunit
MEKDEELFSSTNNILNKIHYTKGKLKEILNKCNDYTNKKQYLEMSIESSKKFNFKELSKEIKKTEKNIEKQEKERKTLEFKQTQLSLLIDEFNHDYRIKKQKIDKINVLEKELEIKKLSYENNKEKKDDIEKRRLNKQEKIKNYETEKEKLFSSNKKLYDLQDYFDVLKEALKDDNIKSHVINILIPFLNQKVNEYLAEIGFDFFVEFDNYMDISISGPGSRYNCKLGSMSGAESKCIDLVTRFALMDLVKIKSKVYPDLLILDELLDSSVDQHGIEKIMNVIRYIQEKNNLKVFIVSHRSELNDFPYGKTYKINKDKKFSYIEA